jgi:hypothetical protein
MRLSSHEVWLLLGDDARRIEGVEYWEDHIGRRNYLLRFPPIPTRTEVTYAVRIPKLSRDERGGLTVTITGWRQVGMEIASFELSLDDRRCPLTIDPEAVRHALPLALADIPD